MLLKRGSNPPYPYNPLISVHFQPMLSSTETPRPLPPAKARRANMLKLSSTPPPAYNSSLTFPSRRQSRQDMPGKPTFHMIGWDSDSAPSPSSPSLGEELLVTAGGEHGPCSFDDTMTG